MTRHHRRRKKGLKEEARKSQPELLWQQCFFNGFEFFSILRHFLRLASQTTDARCFFFLPGWTLSTKWEFPLMKNKSFGPLSSFAFLPIPFFMTWNLYTLHRSLGSSREKIKDFLLCDAGINCFLFSAIFKT